MKIGLGTAQLGMNYRRLRDDEIHESEINDIFQASIDNDIRVFDTSAYYGLAEELVGEFIAKTKSKVDVVTKVNGGEKNLRKIVEKSLMKLRLENVDTHAIHNFHSYQDNPECWDRLLELKTEGMCEKIGFSLYYPKEAEVLWSQGVEFDYVQIPFNVFDQRFEYLFSEFRKRNVKVHVRSTFVFGLVFSKNNQVDSKFRSVEKRLGELERLAHEIGVSKASICVNWGINQQAIKKVILGVESVQDVKKNVKMLDDSEKVKGVMGEIRKLKMDDVNCFLPSEDQYKNYTLISKP
ncbi:aldo/keto reductase [Pseudomonadota bacterium]